MERTLQSSTKRQTVSDEEQNMPSIDRLSSLPDNVICHILSYLPTKLSVLTSILARRWRFLWAHVPNLDFDFNTHNSDTSFTSIINRVMLFHKVQSINSFRLYYEGLDYSEYDIETWITTVIERNVQNLDLDLHCEIIYVLPRCIFTCNTLVDLRLQYCAIPPPSGALSLPSLKKLYLYYVEYMVDEALPQLLSGSPVLEELIIEKVLDDNLGCLNISSSTLKRLTVNFADSAEFDNPNYRVKIDAPALRYLEVHDCSYEHISLSPLTSLIEADIYLNSYSTEIDYYFYTRCVLKFLDGLCNVKCLNLFGWHEKALQNLDLAVAGSIVKFDNLTKLRLAADWLFLSYFLGNADNLQVLIISEVDSDPQCWMDPHQVPKCLLSHLRTIRIDRVWEWTEYAFELIRYLLRNAKVLERMEIYFKKYGTDLKEEFDARKQISSFQRGSEACEIVFH